MGKSARKGKNKLAFVIAQQLRDRDQLIKDLDDAYALTAVGRIALRNAEELDEKTLSNYFFILEELLEKMISSNNIERKYLSKNQDKSLTDAEAADEDF